MSDVNTPPHAPAPHAATPHDGDDAPGMTTPQTLANIFFEPGRTFESLRRRPRFLVAALVMAVLSTVFTVALFEKVGYEKFMREQLENNPRAEQMSSEQKEQALRIQNSPVVKGLTYFSPLLIILAIFAAGGALYMLGAMLMGGAMSYRQGVAVWVYSSLPPSILLLLANFLILLLKPGEDLDPTTPGGNLARANLSLLMDAKASPVLAALLGSFDLFTFYGLFLGALGLRKVGKLSSGAAWTVALGLWLVGILVKVAWAAAFGRSV